MMLQKIPFLSLVIVASDVVVADVGDLPPNSYIQECPWIWICKDERCVKLNKEELEPTEDGLPLQVCKLSCGKYGVLFPRPTGKVEISKGSVMFYPQNVRFAPVASPSAQVTNLTRAPQKIFKAYLTMMHPDNTGDAAPFPSGTEVDPIAANNLVIQINIVHPFTKLDLNTDEGYLLSVQQQDNKHIVMASITANTYFGARHALESLSQLIGYNSLEYYLYKFFM